MFLKQKQLPDDIIDLLVMFGVVLEKPTYVCELSSTKQGHLYQFYYRVVGCVLNEPHPNDSILFNWGCFACDHDSYPYGAFDFLKPHFDLMFVVDLPIED